MRIIQSLSPPIYQYKNAQGLKKMEKIGEESKSVASQGDLGIEGMINSSQNSTLYQNTKRKS